MLDQALIRPGRIDVIANFKKCTNQTLLEMMEFFYERKLDNDCVDRIFVLEEYIISPAEMSKLMFENMEDYEKVIEFLETKSRQYQMEEMKEMEEMEKIEKIEIEKIEKIEIEEMEKMEIEEMEKIEMEKMEHQEVENNFHLLSSTLHDDTMGYAMQSSIGFSHFR